MARGAAAVMRSHLVNRNRKGIGVAETPACRRPGTADATPGCERHAYMYDHYAWASLINETGAVIQVIDQCCYLDDEANAVNVAAKSTSGVSEVGEVNEVDMVDEVEKVTEFGKVD